MTYLAKLADELRQFGVQPELVSYEPNQTGSDMAMPCFVLAKELKTSPQAIAEGIANKVTHPDVAKAEAVAGYINIWVTDELVSRAAANSLELQQSYAGKTVVCEYSDPNPFKVLHAGHLYTSVVGDAISNLYEAAGAKVARVNFGGDVGLHAAKTMWAIIQELGGEHPEKLDEIDEDMRAEWISARYVEGNNEYENNGDSKEAITELNTKIYALHEQEDRQSSFAQIYWTTRQWSYDYFDAFYEHIGTRFDKYYPESQTAPIGMQTVKEQLAKGVYEESDGAVIFDGDKYGLHRRVFINSNGLPTYETKDVGLAIAKRDDYNFDESVMITGNDIVEYMKVVLKSIEQFEPEIAKRSTHITHGMVKLAGGQKMSSRLGNFLKATDVLDAARVSAEQESSNSTQSIVLAAVKYSFLKQGIGQDIHFDPQESVSTHGNSGPYLQYAHARAKSVLAKTSVAASQPATFDQTERELAREVADFPRIAESAMSAKSPMSVAQYLYDLTQCFNRFYEATPIVGSDREPERVWLLQKYVDVLARGLALLGIDAPERM